MTPQNKMYKKDGQGKLGKGTRRSFDVRSSKNSYHFHISNYHPYLNKTYLNSILFNVLSYLLPIYQ